MLDLAQAKLDNRHEDKVFARSSQMEYLGPELGMSQAIR